MKNYFTTESGIKIPAIITEQMIEIDRIAIEETGPNLYQMMENAGRNLALTVMDLVTEISNSSIIILAGTGGNGGGGICAARHLLNRNYNVKLAITDKSKMKDIPHKQLEIFENAGGILIEKFENIKADIVVDAIIGYSLLNAPRGKSLQFIKWANSQNAKKLSLDIPSGINSTTGANYGEYFIADITMTLALPKTGLSEEKCGKLLLADIGISRNVYDKSGIEYNSPFMKEYIIPIS
ncbi:MAG: NAD(P)H-hydrate epimerase [Melioribacteraceae bacterium]|jgi:NAD(P)H-hydrate epimerase|nr:NAD(P)H-hydrate epimerase [Melioribacteraceae bacterium]